MIIENKTPYNDAFWSYLNHRLQIYFRDSQYNYSWIYPIEISINSLFKKRKTTESVIINARVLFYESGKEKEYLGKITCGNYSRKSYVNTKGTDLTKCYPKSHFTKWIKINEPNNEIEINLK